MTLPIKSTMVLTNQTSPAVKKALRMAMMITFVSSMDNMKDTGDNVNPHSCSKTTNAHPMFVEVHK